MPIVDGVSSTKQIREYLYANNLKQPIITGVTGQTEQEYVNRAIENGMNSVLSKPINLELVKMILANMNYI